MTNNNTIKNTITNAQNALAAAQKALEAAKAEAKDFMVEALKENRKNGGDGITVQALADMTGLSNQIVGTMLSKPGTGAWSTTLPVSQYYIEVDKDGKPLTGEIVEKVKKVSAYYFPNGRW